MISKTKIGENAGGFSDTLTSGDNPNGSQGANFGHALCKVGDLNGDGIPDLMTGANQQNEGWGYILYLNSDKTVKSFNRINGSEGGFELGLEPEERFSRSVSYLGDLRGDGTIAVNYGGGAGQGGTGTLYLLFFKKCEFSQSEGLNHWSGGSTLFTNWTHQTQIVSDSLSFEQCSNKAFELDAPYITYNYADGRCICKDSNATLAPSVENSVAFTNECYSEVLPTLSVETKNNIDLSIYPNPVSSELIIEIAEVNFSANIELNIYSVLGENLLSMEPEGEKTSIDISSFSSGIYLFTASLDGEITSFTIVKN